MDALDTEVLIIGSGVAGAYAALTASALGANVLLVTKGALVSGSSQWAQGGIAFPLGLDDISSHLEDTLRAGRGLSDPGISTEILNESLEHLRFLEEIGMHFDDGYALEGGHSKPRVKHAGGDQSGRVLLKFLHSQMSGRISILEQHFAYKLRLGSDGVRGAWVVDRDMKPSPIRSLATILATGGSGQLFTVTTNPPEATGDGVALAMEAGAIIRDIEMSQFHPTSLLNGALVSEACRGAGARLLNSRGEYFMSSYDVLGDLAPRDVVARAVFLETQKTGNVLLDLSPIQNLEDRFPTVYHSIQHLGFDPEKQTVPVAPAAHYQMGGVRTDSVGRTSLGRLYAAGEVASTGFHGANRLASNSLLECLVMGARSAITAVKELEHFEEKKNESVAPELIGISAEHRSTIKTIMTNGASVFRNAHGLTEGFAKINELKFTKASSVFEAENANLAKVAKAVLLGASERRESRGAHFREDFDSAAQHAFHVEQTFGDVIVVDC